ncbi:MAG: methionyl-tRNA formyltransferase, partial [Spirochaetae bacterium HGW-Spirochaetae-6]
MRLNTVFWGNSEFVLPSLEVLARETRLGAIFTGPDQAVGRNLKSVKIPEPKLYGNLHGIPVFQNEDLKTEDLPGEIRKFEPDLMVVISYGKILPERIFSLPPLGTVNLHASLLPDYRGASP